MERRPNNFSVGNLENQLHMHMVAVKYILSQLLERHGIEYVVTVEEVEKADPNQLTLEEPLALEEPTVLKEDVAELSGVSHTGINSAPTSRTVHL